MSRIFSDHALGCISSRGFDIWHITEKHRKHTQPPNVGVYEWNPGYHKIMINASNVFLAKNNSSNYNYLEKEFEESVLVIFLKVCILDLCWLGSAVPNNAHATLFDNCMYTKGNFTWPTCYKSKTYFTVGQ